MAVEDLRLGLRSKLVGQNVIHRQQEADAFVLRLGQSLLGHVDLVGLEQRFPDLLPLGLQEGVGHASADRESRPLSPAGCR